MLHRKIASDNLADAVGVSGVLETGDSVGYAHTRTKFGLNLL
jgi:hypothetical protein